MDPVVEDHCGDDGHADDGLKVIRWDQVRQHHAGTQHADDQDTQEPTDDTAVAAGEGRPPHHGRGDGQQFGASARSDLYRLELAE